MKCHPARSCSRSSRATQSKDLPSPVLHPHRPIQSISTPLEVNTLVQANHRLRILLLFVTAGAAATLEFHPHTLIPGVFGLLLILFGALANTRTRNAACSSCNIAVTRWSSWLPWNDPRNPRHHPPGTRANRPQPGPRSGHCSDHHGRHLPYLRRPLRPFFHRCPPSPRLVIPTSRMSRGTTFPHPIFVIEGLFFERLHLREGIHPG